jgi:hypothetical protein
VIDHAESVSAAIDAALASAESDDLIRRVKTAVADELQALSPDAKVEFTEYFNHSYMADLFVRWGSGNAAVTRPVYLRGTLRPSTASDVDALETLEPMVVGLRRPIGPTVDLAPLRSRVIASNRVLVTDMPSVSRLVAPPASDPSQSMRQDEGAAEVPAPRTPLLQLVQANFVRGARGLVGAEEVQQLTAGATTAPTDALSDATLRAFQEAAGTLFVEDAALRLRRAAELLRRSVAVDAPTEADVPLDGRLSEVELRVLIPYLLKLEGVALSPSYWRSLGDMMDLEMLEALWVELAGVDVTPLVVPNLTSWTAKRSQLVLNAAYEPEGVDEPQGRDTSQVEGPAFVEAQRRPDDVTFDDPSTSDRDADAPTDAARGPWRVSSHLLNVEVGPWRAWFATDSRRLRGRGAGLAARWGELAPYLSSYHLQSVDLLGVARRIAVSAEQSASVLADVDTIGDTIADEFHVEDVAVRVGEAEDSPVVDLALAGMTATARKPETLANLLSVSLDVLGHRRPTPYDHVLATASTAVFAAEPAAYPFAAPDSELATTDE